MKPVPIRGVYAITPDTPDPQQLLAQVRQVLHQGIDGLQLRMKQLAAPARLGVAQSVQTLCAAAGVPLIINDDLELALAVDAAGVHLGRDDAAPEHARARLGPQRILGISSYDSLERAQRFAPIVDYIALGSVFASPTKPNAPRAALNLFGQARALGLHTVAIGGIDAHNARQVIEAGADAVAVISAVFAAADPVAATRTLHGVVHAVLNQRDAQPRSA